MPKMKNNPRFVLTCTPREDAAWVAVSEGNSNTEFKRLKKLARETVQSQDIHKIAIYLCMDGSPSQANLLTDVEVAKWRTKAKQ